MPKQNHRSCSWTSAWPVANRMHGRACGPWHARQVLVDIAKSQDSEVGDGTTSVVVIANELLAEAKQFIEDGVHPQIIIKSYRTAATMALAKLQEWSTKTEEGNAESRRTMLERCAANAPSHARTHARPD